MEDAKKLTQVGSDGVMTVAGMHYTNSDQLFTYFLAGILEQGADYFAEDGKHFNFNSPEAVATIQKLIDRSTPCSCSLPHLQSHSHVYRKHLWSRRR